MAQDIAEEAMRQGGFDPTYWFTLVAVLIGIVFICFIGWTIYQMLFD